LRRKRRRRATRLFRYRRGEGKTSGMIRSLVTAGSTRERIDEVREWGNIFSGKTGFAIAKALTEVGEVDLLTSNSAHASEAQTGKFAHRLGVHRFESHADLKRELAARMADRSYDAVFMVAAVADYSPVRVYSVVSRDVQEGTEIWHVRDAQAGKVKSTHEEIAVLGKRTEKLVDLFRTEWKHRGLLVKFKLEVGLTKERLIEVGSASRVASGADYLVANTLDMVEGDKAGGYLIGEAKAEWVPRNELAWRMRDLVRARA
jgi:phosphopantothenoylcysteine synthetase/decarboxylase